MCGKSCKHSRLHRLRHLWRQSCLQSSGRDTLNNANLHFSHGSSSSSCVPPLFFFPFFPPFFPFPFLRWVSPPSRTFTDSDSATKPPPTTVTSTNQKIANIFCPLGSKGSLHCIKSETVYATPPPFRYFFFAHARLSGCFL